MLFHGYVKKLEILLCFEKAGETLPAFLDSLVRGNDKAGKLSGVLMLKGRA